jgi:hypothetical protein
MGLFDSLSGDINGLFGGSSASAPSTPMYNVNPNAFNNVVGNQAPAWNTAQSNYLGQTTVAAPTLGPAATVQQPEAVGGMSTLANTLQNTANGQGPSVAATTAAQQGARDYAGSLGMLGAARGGMSPALAAYNAGNAYGNAAENTAANATLGRANEAMTAQGQLGNVLNAQGNLVSNNNQFNANAGNNFAIQNANNYLSNRNINNAAYQNNMNNLSQQVGVQNQGQQNYQTLAQANQAGQNALNSSNFNSSAGRDVQLVGAAGGALSAAAMMSDRRTKYRIKPASAAMRELLSSVKPSYLGAK